jgi:mRNA-decapping enzyme subunit 2
MEPDTFFQLASFEQVLDDLSWYMPFLPSPPKTITLTSASSSRFIVNIPPEELVSVPRICFQIEQAHWFYEDFVREQNPHRLPSLSLRKFSKCIFDHCPLLWQYSGSHEEEFEDFLRYKKRVPVLGGILLDENWEKVFILLNLKN